MVKGDWYLVLSTLKNLDFLEVMGKGFQKN
jgi:hypothetical protein